MPETRLSEGEKPEQKPSGFHVRPVDPYWRRRGRLRTDGASAWMDEEMKGRRYGFSPVDD